MTPKCTGSMQVDAFVGICLPAGSPVPAWSTSYGLIRSLSADRLTHHSAATRCPRPGPAPSRHSGGQRIVLAKDIDYVIGVDTHKDSHSAALVNSTGGVITALDVTASEAGYRRLLALANRQALVDERGRWKAPAVMDRGWRPSSCNRVSRCWKSNDLDVRARSPASQINSMRSRRRAKPWQSTSWPCLVGEERGRRFEFCWQLEKEPSKRVPRRFASCTRWWLARRRCFAAVCGA